MEDDDDDEEILQLEDKEKDAAAMLEEERSALAVELIEIKRDPDALNAFRQKLEDQINKIDKAGNNSRDSLKRRDMLDQLQWGVDVVKEGANIKSSDLYARLK